MERSGSISPTCSTLREFQRQADRQAIDLIADDQRASGVTSYCGRIGGNPARAPASRPTSRANLLDRTVPAGRPARFSSALQLQSVRYLFIPGQLA